MRAALPALVVALVLAAGQGQAACARPAGGDAAAAELYNLTNALRHAEGRGVLLVDAALTVAAQAQACHMARSGRMGHAGPGGSGVGERAGAAGYAWGGIAENVAAGQRDAGAVAAGWRRSPGHRRNMLDPAAQHIGLGVAEAGGRLYWAMVLGRPLR
jgi:uncharacterized protein YkwD